MLRLHDPFDFWVREAPDEEFATFAGRRTTYREAAEQVHRLANALLGCGLRPGDRFAYLSKNSVEYAFMFYAASKVGAVPVPLNYRLAPPEWQYIVQRRAGAPADRARRAGRGDRAGARRARRPSSAASHSVPRARPRAGRTTTRSSRPRRRRAPAVEVSSGDDVYQMYTSGTTGRPKGAVLTHGGADGTARAGVVRAQQRAAASAR